MRDIAINELVGRGYRDFWRCRARYRVLKGGKASKKSSTTALWYIYHLMKYPEANLLVVRNVCATHLDSTLAQLKWAIRRLGVEGLWKATVSPPELRYLPTGQRILFRGMDDPDKLASTTVEQGVLCWVWVEEAFEITDEEAFNRLDLSVPRGEMPPGLFKQTTLTFNPWSRYHWLKSRFFDRPQPDVHTFTTNYLCNEFLDDTDRAIYARMQVEEPVRYRVAGLGEWGVDTGLIFTRFSAEPFDPAALPARCRHVFGLDYGYSNDPTAFIAAAVDMQEQVLYIYDEHYGYRMLNRDIAEMLRKKGYQKERIRADAAEPKSNEELRRLGISRIAAAAKGPDSVRAGIDRLQSYRMVVHPRCVHTLSELESYCWETGRDGGGRNRPMDRDNHLMDALRYAMEDAVRPPGETISPPRYRGGITADDLRGGWE
ncbi:MAG: PBSX family phage terminase large subunit [Clostridia bacterium]|nr:PBSX family phage terminase large subunit [Clostridia bacterium]